MKVILIHGEDVLKARKRYGTIIGSVKKKGWQIVHTNLTSKVALAEVLVSNLLFPGDVLYTVDSLSDLTDSDLLWLKDKSNLIEGNLLLFFKGDAPQKFLKHLPKNSKVEKFDLPKMLFQFLESIYPGNQKQALIGLHTVLKSAPEELVLAMIARQFRDLYWFKSAKESMQGQSWKLAKLQKQATCFSTLSLKEFIAKLAKADSEAKTGGAPLGVSLDLLLSRQLQ